VTVIPATDWFEVFVDQTRLPSVSQSRRSPLAVKLRVAFSRTGRPRFADQTICRVPAFGQVRKPPLSTWRMQMPK
jgi:hypothetical protein